MSQRINPEGKNPKAGGGPIRRTKSKLNNPYPCTKVDDIEDIYLKKTSHAKTIEAKIAIEEDKIKEDNTKTQNKNPHTDKEMQDEDEKMKRRSDNCKLIEGVLKFYEKRGTSVTKSPSVNELNNLLTSTKIKENNMDTQNKEPQTHKDERKCDKNFEKCATGEDMEDLYRLSSYSRSKA